MPININAVHKAYSSGVASATAGALARFRGFVSHNQIPAGTPGMKIGHPVKGVNPAMDFAKTPSGTAGNFGSPRGTLDSKRIEVEIEMKPKIFGDSATFLEQQQYPANWLNSEGVEQGGAIASYLTGIVGDKIMNGAGAAPQSLTLPAGSGALVGAALAARIRRVGKEAAHAPNMSDCYLACDPLTYEKLGEKLPFVTSQALANFAVSGDIGQLLGFKGVLEIPGLDAPYVITPSGLTIGHKDPNISMMTDAGPNVRREVIAEPITGIRILNTVVCDPLTGTVSYSSLVIAGAERLTRAVNLDEDNADGKGKGIYQMYKVVIPAT